MSKIRLLEIIIFTSIIFFLSIASSKAAFFGGCDINFMDSENNVYYLKLRVSRDFAGDLPFVYTAKEGDFNDCREFFSSNEREPMKVMKGAGPGWSSHSNLTRINITKSDFCKSNGPYSLYGLGESALKYCWNSNYNSTIDQNKKRKGKRD